MQCISTGELNTLDTLVFEGKIPIVNMVGADSNVQLTLHNGNFVDKCKDRYFAVEASNKIYTEVNVLFN